MSSPSLKVGDFTISDDSDCFVIAEIGHNHQGDLEKCKEMFAVAKGMGADAVKLQKRDNRQLFTRAMYDSPYEHRNSYGATYGEHRDALEFDMSGYRELKRYAKELGILFFSTAFDIPSADFLEELDMPAVKVASGDVNNLPLLERIAKMGKPIFLSTGGAQMDDVVRAHDTIMAINTQLCILQCTSGYPAEFSELNLRVIETFKEQFPNCVIGLSSHDSGIAMASVGFALGARVVEKHFTLNRALKGTDHAFSLEPDGLRKLVRDLRRARVALGDGVKRRYPSEEKPLYKMGKKIVAARDLPAGHVITASDLVMKSPNDGMPPSDLHRVLGRATSRAIKADDNIETVLSDLSLVPEMAPAAKKRAKA